MRNPFSWRYGKVASGCEVVVVARDRQEYESADANVGTVVDVTDPSMGVGDGLKYVIPKRERIEEM